jgi:hypothetical protein
MIRTDRAATLLTHGTVTGPGRDEDRQGGQIYLDVQTGQPSG